jgi:hypothetical protein
MVETPEIAYGKMNKKVVFTVNDHRHAQMIIRLKHDDLRQSQFFRALMEGYIEQDERILSFIDDLKAQSVKKKTKSKKLRAKGNELLSDSGFSNDQLDDLFDLIAEEHPDL